MRTGSLEDGGKDLRLKWVGPGVRSSEGLRPSYTGEDASGVQYEVDERPVSQGKARDQDTTPGPTIPVNRGTSDQMSGRVSERH